MRVVPLIAVLCCLFIWPADADPQRAGHFVEFHARPGALWGHTFIVYGRRDTGGRMVETHRAGLYPDGGRAALIMGTFIPVAARVQAVPGDYSERPSAIYRRNLTASQYAHLTRTVARLRARERAWHMVMFNCNDFGIVVARELGLAAPPNMLVPNAWVRALAAINGG
jgi:hypothetical protein